SMFRWCCCIGFLLLFFTYLYTLVGIDYGAYPTRLSSLYFSVVTLTTLGFGDVKPNCIAGQIVVMLEVSMGYVMLGGLLSIFSNKLARRGD
ncbi:MAG: potassium channel family protein, partial [Thermodesulfobacteriota bacterium]|nr:potassium channel family protein [Thermodesulfobacteriota bacterium]